MKTLDYTEVNKNEAVCTLEEWKLPICRNQKLEFILNPSYTLTDIGNTIYS